MSADLLADFDSFYQSPVTSTQSKQAPAPSPSPGWPGSADAPSDVWKTTSDFEWRNDAHKKTFDTQRDPSYPPSGFVKSEEDDFGAFESGSFGEDGANPWQSEPGNTTRTSAPQTSTDWANQTFTSAWEPLNSAVQEIEFQPARSEDAFASSDIWGDLPRLKTQNQSQTKQPEILRTPRDENILFDAEEETLESDEEDGDFGDFETAEDDGRAVAESTVLQNAAKHGPIYQKKLQSPSQPQKENQATLIDFDFEPAETPPTVPAQTSSPSYDMLMDNTDHGPTRAVSNVPVMHVEKQRTDSKPEVPAQVPDEDDAWNEWEDFTEIRPSSVQNEPPEVSNSSAVQSPWEEPWSEEQPAPQPPPPLELPILLPFDAEESTVTPPTNIPPPTLLLSLFPPIFSLVQEQLFDPLQSSAVHRDQVVKHSSTRTFLTSFLQIAAVLARVVAGRKLRWKRDTILSQSMSIGPASASGKSRGMKLTGLDKSESVREDREVADVVRQWRVQLGRLRTLVSSIGPGNIYHVPDVSEAMPVRQAQESEGAVNAPKPCVLCGLKRNERVQKVDVNVQDSFGEFWVDYWGHRDCMRFWENYQGELKAR